MFGLFSNKQPGQCPIDTQTRLWMEHAFLWLAWQFGRQHIATKPMLFPLPEHFPIHYDGSRESLIATADIVARQMEMDGNEINLEIYHENIHEFKSDFGFRIYTQIDEDSEEKITAGLYFGKNEQGKYDVFIERRNLYDPENLVATLAHEFSHIKLLGEKRVTFNDESLTDLTTIIFGIGIFNANGAFKEYKSFDSRGHSALGYLTQREWGYALALYAFYRQEKDPEWIRFLTPNIKSDFKKSSAFMYANEDKVFKEEYKPNKPNSD